MHFPTKKSQPVCNFVLEALQKETFWKGLPNSFKKKIFF